MGTAATRARSRSSIKLAFVMKCSESRWSFPCASLVSQFSKAGLHFSNKGRIWMCDRIQIRVLAEGDCARRHFSATRSNPRSALALLVTARSIRAYSTKQRHSHLRVARKEGSDRRTSVSDTRFSNQSKCTLLVHIGPTIP
jgi:hypothetical protein